MLQYENLVLDLYQGHIPKNLMHFRGGDVYAIARELKESGLIVKDDARFEEDGRIGAWIEDPDGILIYFNPCSGEEAV